MTLGELKAFIEGMGIEECPTPKQWARIKEKLEEVQPQIVPISPQPSNPLERWRWPDERWTIPLGPTCISYTRGGMNA